MRLVYCLNFGQMLAEGLPEDVRNHPEVVTAYLGEDADPGAAAVESQLESVVEGG